MKVQKNSVVSMNYKLTSDGGDLIDASKDTPLAFIFGIGHIIPGLEAALDGKAQGDKVTVRVDPKEGYGERNEEMIYNVPNEQLASIPNLSLGMQLELSMGEESNIVTVTEIKDDSVVLDGNHPLAGHFLNFDVEIVDIREATKEELDHGHVHGEGGHSHD